MQGLINPKLMDESTKEADNFRVTNANFNAQTNAVNKQFIAADDEYEYCPNCSRKFFTGRLRLHLKSCKDGKPLKPLKNKTSRDQNAGENKDQFLELNKTNENNTSYRGHMNEEANETSSFGLNGVDSTRDKSPTVESLKSKQNLQENSPLRESFKTPKKEKVNPAETFSGDKGYNKENIEADNKEDNEENNDENEENEGNKNNAYEMGNEVEMRRADDNRVPCSICGRNFYEDRIKQHENACKKSNKKRAVFDTSKQRAIPDAETGMKRPADKTKSKKAILPPKAEKVIVEEEKKPVEAQKEDKSAKKANWKAQHENFIENIRFNRKLKDMEAKGEDTKGLVAPTLVNDDYVHCSYCNRKFAPKTAERHIPKCKNTFNRPKPPKNLQLDKIEDVQRADRAKTKFILKKGFNARMSPSHGDAKSPVTPNTNGQNNTSTDKFNKNASHRSPHSNFSTGNYENQLNQIDDSFKGKGSPKENAKKSQMSNLKTESKITFKKLNSLNDTGKTLNEMKNGQDTSPQGHEIKLSDKKGRDYRSQSPGGARDGKKVFTEAMPKKEDLLVNYQNIFDRSSGYSTECCPYCSRKFSHHAAERHIPVCKNLKTKPLKKNDQDTTITEEKFKSKMFMTGLGTKAEFNKKLEENGENPKSVPKGPSTDYERFFSSKSKINRSGEKPPLPTRKPLNGGLMDANEIIPERVSMLQKAKLAAAHSASSFCTSCGTKTLKTHNFCGFCGTKKGVGKQ